ncbi:glycosyltransferase family 4 protein [Cryobacterium sp. N21]|uniref:glycosyltransferase family 4 protein n=1 Tax=Cryobacterium sp. N21 TaxID=2048289 RepID=UPI000CE4A119|nr:glycosyltransferase family 4 protein [Cryobacterium sp. N21]
MSIVFLRASHVSPDPRIEKEVRSLIKRYPNITILAWDRDGGLARSEVLDFDLGNANIIRSAIRGRHGRGIKNIVALFRFQFFLVFQIWKLRHEVEVIHAADLSTAATGFFCSRILRIPLVYDIFDYYVDGYPVPKALKPLVEWLDIRIINRANAVIIATEARVDQIRPALPRSLLVIHNTPDLAPIVPDANLANSNRLVYVGILSEHRLLVELLGLFSRRPDLELHIGGFGPLEAMVKEFAQNFRNIIYYGRISYIETLALESTALALFAVYDPSIANHAYSAPNKFYEALSLGKPVIVARGTGVDRLVESFAVGIVVDYDANSFEQAVDDLLRDPVGAKAMGDHGRVVFRDEFDWPRMESRLHSLYATLIETE